MLIFIFNNFYRSEFGRDMLGSATFEVRSLSLNDNGIYKCVASNAASTAEELIQLIVEDDSLPTRGDTPGIIFFKFI